MDVWSFLAIASYTIAVFYLGFTIGKDLEIYDGLDDLLEKTDYYLKHDEKRIAIARHGFDTVRKKHTYNTRLKEIFRL